MDISVVRKEALKEKLKVARKAVADASRALEKEQSKQVRPLFTFSADVVAHPPTPAGLGPRHGLLRGQARRAGARHQA